MLASELAMELETEQSLMSKRLGIYFAERGLNKPRLLDEQSVRDVRQAYQILATGQAKTFKQAVQLTLGTHIEAVPPESVRNLERRLERIEQVQAETLDKVSQVLRHMEATLARRSAQGGQQGQ